MKFDENKIQNILERGVEEVIEKDHLAEALHSGKRLVVKFGIDPTSPDLHLGHMVPLRKLRQFQDAGHHVALIIGDFTATIGDPSGRSEERKPLSQKEVKNNLKKYLSLANKILDIKKCKISYNSSWFKKAGVEKILELSRASSLQQTLKRADFQERMNAGNDISMLELWYPLFQGYDSVKVKANVEIGGTDQKFNLLMGRRVQRHFGTSEQDVMTLPLIEGTDGKRKMSKSYGNYIALDEKPDRMYGKVLSAPDSLVKKYFTTLTDVSEKEVSKLSAFEQKKLLAREIISSLYSQSDAEKSEKLFFESTEKKAQTEIKVLRGTSWIAFLKEHNYSSSVGEAKRLIEQGGVSLNGVKVKEHGPITDGGVVKVGKKIFIKIKVEEVA